MQKFALAALVVAAAFSAPADAATVIYSGNLTGSDSTYNRVTNLSALSGVGTNVHFDTYEFHVSDTGLFNFSMTSNSIDTFLSLYVGSFNPGQALQNLVAYNDDAGFSLNSAFSNLLQSGQTYIAVASSFSNRERGRYDLTIRGNGDITSGPAPIDVVPEPASWAMLIGGFGLVGVAMRRRKTKSVLA